MRGKSKYTLFLSDSLKYRFELNLKDCLFVVESLLPALKDALFEELNVELSTTKLKQRQGDTQNALLEESKREKRELWNTLKVQSFTRTLASVYLVNLVTILTCVQLSLVGRYVYLDSVLTSNLKESTLEDDQVAAEKIIADETERKYLTLSWYLLNIGWKDCVKRVQEGVEKVVGP
jgi:peroxin-3